MKQNKTYNKKYILQTIREITRDIKFYDAIMVSLLIASGIQLAIAYSYSTIFSIVAAIFKAAGIEAANYIFNKGISRAKEFNLQSKFLWVSLIVVMGISTKAALAYEYEKKLQSMNIAIVTSETIDNNLSISDKLDAWFASGIINFLILGIAFARSQQKQIAGNFQTVELKELEKKSQAKNYYQIAKAKKLAELRKLGGKK